MFYNMVDTSVRLKVAWLLDRKARGLRTPEKMCCLKSDGEFCNGGLVGGWEKGRLRVDPDGAGQVSSIMARRRRHGECDHGRCEVLVGRRCGGWKEVDGLRMEIFGLRSWVGDGFLRVWSRVTRFDSLMVGYGLWILVGLMGLVFAFTLELL